MSETDRINVDSLELGVRIHPVGSYIGGELTALRAKTADNPLVFHLSMKTRHGRSTIIVQCAKFPSILDGTGVLEEAHSFLETRFRQHIRLQADVGNLEVLEILRQRGGPKRIDVRYGFGGILLAQDGSQLHLKQRKYLLGTLLPTFVVRSSAALNAASSWFPSQNSSESEAKQSSSEQLVTVAAQNSPLAAFPVSPPTSEPPVSAAKKSLQPSGDHDHSRAKSAIAAEDVGSRERPHKKRRVGTVVTDLEVPLISDSTGKQRLCFTFEGMAVDSPKDLLRPRHKRLVESSDKPVSVSTIAEVLRS